MKLFLALIQLLFASSAIGEVRTFADARSAARVEAVENIPPEKHCAAIEKPVYYTIRSGDHLEKIVDRFGFKPLYGKHSQIIRVSALNKIKDPNIILAGGEILLPFKCEEDIADYVLIDREQSRLIEANIAKVETGTARLPSATDVAQQPAPVLASAPPVETPAAVPTASPTTDETSFVPHSTLSVGALYGFYRLDSKEIYGSAQALLLSRPSLGFELGWELQWQENFATGFRLNGRSIEFQRATSGVLNNGKQTTSGVGLDFKNQWTKKFKSTLGLNYDERLYVRALQTGIAVIDVYHQPSFVLIVEHELIRAGSLGLDLMAGYRHLLNAATETLSLSDSSEYLIGATFRQQLEKRQIELKINYVTGQQKSSYSTQDNAGLEARIGIKMEIGK